MNKKKTFERLTHTELAGPAIMETGKEVGGRMRRDDRHLVLKVKQRKILLKAHMR